jgi:hypothetical protein
MQIDLDFRPASCWDFADPVAAIAANIKGDLRRAAVRELLARGEDVEPALLEPSACESLRAAMERIHPQWMGGEYLPDYLPGEVEIARVVLNSTTRDVYSVRARCGGKRIRYRIVDEYEGTWKLARRSSVRPLSLRELIDLIDSAAPEGVEWSGASNNLTDNLRDWTCVDSDDDSESAVDFVTVSSEHYPELERYYRIRVEEWRRCRRCKTQAREDA